MQDLMSNIIEEYKKAQPIYEEYTKEMNKLISSLLNESEIKVHSVNGRAKGIENLEEKLWRKGNSYDKLSDITDLSGIRIICYFSSQVEDVAEVIGQNFTIVPELSIDKRKLLDPDRFGYLSLHYVVKLSDTRKNLLEYRKYQNILCEIQIRSILQHSWAEIEHDLGYKSSIEIPRDIKRRFYRLSGLLELADDEFTNLKDEIEEYSISLKNQQIEFNEEIYIDAISLNKYISKSSTIKEIDKIIVDTVAGWLVDKQAHTMFFKIVSYFNIHKIHELNKTLEENKDEIISFAKEWNIEPDPYGNDEFQTGISIFYLGYVLIGKTMDINQINDYIKTVSIYASYKDGIPLVERIKNTYKKIHSML